MTAALELTQEEIDALLPPPELTIDEWAEKNVVLPRAMAAEPGPISIDRNPYLREILRAATNPDVEEITMCFSRQTGKTTAPILCNLYWLTEDPWPCLHVLNREDDATSLNVERYQRIIKESPALKSHVSAPGDLKRDMIRLNGASAYFSGANSKAGLISRPICKLCLDEVDSYQLINGVDPVSIARETTRTFSNRKLFKVSTPSTELGFIWREYQDSDKRRFWVPCPHCGTYQVLVFGDQNEKSPGLKWPEEETDPRAIRDQKLATYRCGSCYKDIVDIQKPKMLRAGVWAADGCKVDKKGRVKGDNALRGRVGYHLHAIYSPWVSFSDVAAEYLRSYQYPGRYRAFLNEWLAEVWEDKVDELRGSDLRRCIDTNYKQVEVPENAYVLTAGVDVQSDHLYYVIRAWGALGESWLVRYGRVENWEALRTVLLRSRYRFKNSKEIAQLGMVCIDIGYNVRAHEVRLFCKEFGCYAVKGMGTKISRPWQFSKDKSTVVLDTNFFKTKVHRLIHQPETEPGAWHLPVDTTEQYFMHMTAEQRVKVQDKQTGQIKLVWKVLYDGARNDLFDCECYATAAATILDVENRWTKPPQRGAEREEELSKPKDKSLARSGPRRRVRNRPKFRRLGKMPRM